jgi:hypothetical protein
MSLREQLARQLGFVFRKAAGCPTCGGPPHDDLTIAPEDWKP